MSTWEKLFSTDFDREMNARYRAAARLPEPLPDEPEDKYPRCATCRHWHESAPDRGTCAAVKPRHDLDSSTPVLTAIVQHSDSDDYTFLITAPTFGCVLHEERGPA